MGKKIVVWMPDDDTALNTDIQSDVIKAVKAAGGYMLVDECWNYIAVGNEAFTPEEASAAMKEQSGDVPVNPKDWTVPEEE